jgi:hypothetical protein
MSYLKSSLSLGVLVIFLLVAGSVACLAATQGMPMAANCGGGMASAAACPFMTVSIPAVTAGLVARNLILVIGLLVAIGFSVSVARDIDASNKRLFVFARAGDAPTGRRSDVVLDLISRGVLHSRVFDC